MILRRGYQFTPGYRLQEYVGKGQFGEVWRASGPGGVTLAVKFIDLTGGSGKQEYAAIKRIKSIRQANLMQITAIWQLDEEGNVLPEPPDEAEQTIDLFELDSRNESGFVVSPGPEPATLVVGMLLGDASLEKFLPRKGDETGGSCVPPGDLLRYMEGVARGLDFLNAPKHDFGAGPVALQHCDIKPANIVLIGDSAVICDFGLARILQRSQATLTQAAGTPAYMSPEAIDGKPSCNSDQYSLAVTYYHLRTGTLPVRDGSVYQVLQAHRSGDLDFDRVAHAEREILRRATHMDWRERFPNNTAFVDAIRVALTQRGLHDIGLGAGPTKKHASDPLPPSGPNGPAVEGIQTIAPEDLTGGFVRQTKGGSPILSDRADHNRAQSDPRNDPASLRLDQTPIPLDGLPGYEGKNDARQVASDADRQSRDSAPQRLGIGKLSPKTWIMSLSAATLLVALVWWRFTVDPPVIPPVPTPVEMFGEAAALLDNDIEGAKQKFESAIGLLPSLKQPAIEFATDRHQGAIEVAMLIGEEPRLVTTGYDNRPRLWSNLTASSSAGADLVAPRSLSSVVPSSGVPSSVVIANLPANTYYREAICLTADRQWLLIGVGNTLQAWRVDRLLTSDRSAFPVQPMVQLSLEEEVLSLAAHPQQFNRVIVGLASLSAVVVDLELAERTANQEPAAAMIARSALVDVVPQMSVLQSGNIVLMRQEGGDLVALDWESLATNDPAVAATPQSPTGMTNVREMVVPFHDATQGQEPSAFATLPDDLFWVGDDEGILSGYVVRSDSDERFFRWFVDDDLHQTGITVLKSARFAKEECVLASGAEDGRIAIHRFSVAAIRAASSSKSNSGALITPVASAVELGDGPVRCLNISSDGKWLVAGGKSAVWAIHLASPLERIARIPVGDVTVESIAIDSVNDQLIIGCGDGRLGRLNWSHCRLRTLVSPMREDASESDESPAPKKQPDGRLTLHRSVILPILEGRN